MPDEQIVDDERLAALLAGRLDPDERNRLLSHLASDKGDDYEVFAGTATILREMEEEDGVPGPARSSSWALRAIRAEPLRALITATATAMATAAARVRRWVISARARRANDAGVPVDGGDRAALAGKHLIMDGDEGDGPALACPTSRMVSWNPNDAENGYCAAPTCQRYLYVDEVLDVRERPN